MVEHVGMPDVVGSAAAIAPGDRILDVGCGTGTMSRAAARLADQGSALGVDIGRPLVKEARAETTAEGGPGSVAFEQADAQLHPFPPAPHVGQPTIVDTRSSASVTTS
jgi:ubiquinone/menaquinone biosynthesis C-methylase UbiE